MNNLRHPTYLEIQLLALLVEKSGLLLDAAWADTLMVQTMDDGGMGSLTLYFDGNKLKPTPPIRIASEYQFTDTDGVEVLASLFVEKNNCLFELNMWKVDFNPLHQIPNNLT